MTFYNGQGLIDWSELYLQRLAESEIQSLDAGSSSQLNSSPPTPLMTSWGPSEAASTSAPEITNISSAVQMLMDHSAEITAFTSIILCGCVLIIGNFV